MDNYVGSRKSIRYIFYFVYTTYYYVYIGTRLYKRVYNNGIILILLFIIVNRIVSRLELV